MNQEHSVVPCSLAQGDLLKNRCARALGTAGLALMLGAASFGVARAESAPVGVPDKSFPENFYPELRLARSRPAQRQKTRRQA